MKRFLCGAFVALGLLASGAVSAQQLPEPAGPVVLTITGTVEKANRGPFDPFMDGLLKSHGVTGFQKAATFDVAMLEALGMKSLTVRYPEWPKGYTFEGPLLRDVLKAAGARGSAIRFLGLDGYEPEIPVTDAYNHDAVLAVKADGRYLGIGDRGPVWLVYPRDTDPKLKDMDDAKWLWAGFFMTVE